jgi:3-(3-hydroxy-phenyl)propionate hydroxylase
MNTKDENTKKFQVLIIGCGPTGVVLANLLGNSGIKVGILEKEKNIYPVPRATHIDEETLRNFQATGLMRHLIKHTSTFGYVDIVDENNNILMEETVKDTNSNYGYDGSCFFDQPAIEKVLREGLQQYPNVEIFTGTEAISSVNIYDSVHITARNINTAEDIFFQADWVIGCDGGRSFVRTQEDIGMDSLAPKKYWLIVDTLLKDPKDASLLPDRFRYVLNPERLTIYAYGFGNNRRWEFQLEEGEEAPDHQIVTKWLEKFIDPEKLEIIRVLPYSHNSLVAKTWRKGRLLIAGDAAHMMPPSAGQGMCSGIRDAINLAWKLQLVINERAGEEILNTYEEERKPHVEEILKGSLFISDRINAGNDFQKWLRNLQLKIISKLPPLQALIRHASLRKTPLVTGFLEKESKLSGHHLPQFKVSKYHENLWSDDLLGYQFALITANDDFDDEVNYLIQGAGILLVNRETDYRYFQGSFNSWMKENNIEYVIVRPDRIIYSAGKNVQLKWDLQNMVEKFNSKVYSLNL